MTAIHCIWQENSNGSWETSCKNVFVLNDGTYEESVSNICPEDGMKYCCYCGNEIVSIPFAGSVDDNEQEAHDDHR